MAAPNDAAPQDQLQHANEELYKHSLELAVKNKTLSLLRQLYQISILALEPEPLAEKITEIVRSTLELEMVGVFLFDEASDSLVPLRINRSPRFEHVVAGSDHPFAMHNLTRTKENSALAPLFAGTPIITGDVGVIWHGIVSDDALARITDEGHIKTYAAFPLIIDGTLMGALMLSINRAYDQLNEYERESITSLVEVTAVALDRARLYQELKTANTKLEDANNRLKELDQMKNEFLSIASHQLRAPITAIRGYAANIADGSYGAVAPEVAEPLGVIQESARLMANSIEDYLNISRIEQGRMKYEKSVFDIADLSSKVVNELAPLAAKKGLALTFAPGAPLMVDADIGKMKQVITNLTDNAVKYTEQGSVTLSAAAADGKARVTIADTGIGIAPDEIDKLFTKFTRARDANKVNTTGTGLGLYVAKQLAEGNGGAIRIESDGLGKGTRFIVELPVTA